MKLIGKQIVVELPEERKVCRDTWHGGGQDYKTPFPRSCPRCHGIHSSFQTACDDEFNKALSEVAKMNPAWEVDIEGLARTMYEIPGTVPIWEDISYELRCAYTERAKIIASDPSRWLKRKDSDEAKAEPR